MGSRMLLERDHSTRMISVSQEAVIDSILAHLISPTRSPS